MLQNSLQQCLTQIQQFCQEHNIALAFGEVSAIDDVEVQLDKNQPGTPVEQMLTLARQAGVRLVNVEVEENDLLIDDEELQEYLAELEEEEDRATTLQEVALVRKHQGEWVQLALSFYYHGGLYRCEQKAEWGEAYDNVREFLYSSDNDDEDDYDDDDDYEDDFDKEEMDEEKTTTSSNGKETQMQQANSGVSSAETSTDEPGRRFAVYMAMKGKRNELPGETIEEQARLLIASEKYLRAKTKMERRVAATQLLQQQGFAFLQDRWLIEERAEDIYQEEVVPRLEQAIIEKIRAYQATAARPTMAGAARLLSMDVRRVGLYWERANEQMESSD